MPQSRYERNVGALILAGCLIVGAGVLGYVTWDAINDDEVGIESVPIALWSSAIALFGMAVVYIGVRLRERRRSSDKRSSADY